MFKNKKKDNISNSADSDSKNTNNNRNKIWKLVLKGSLILAVLGIIIAILCSFLIQRTKEVTVRDIPTVKQYLAANPGVEESEVANDFILQIAGGTYVTVSEQNLQHAEISAIGATGRKTIYLVYLPNTSIGNIKFLFSIFDNSYGPSAIQIGSTVVALQNTATIAYLTLNQKAIKNSTNLPYSDIYSIVSKRNIITPNYLRNNLVTTNNIPGVTQVSQIVAKYKGTNIGNFLEYVYLNTNVWLFPSRGFNWSVFFQIVFLVIYVILILSLVFGMYKGGSGMAGGDIFSIGKSPAKFAKTNVRFSDVGGIGEEKFELQEIVDFLKKPSKYASMGARIPKGVILYGPPGTGKTLLAKAVAGEAGVPFLETSGSSFEDMLVGVGAKRVRDLFARAKKAAPSIIFIDEIDSVAGKRSSSRMGDGSIANQTINELLSQMDGFNSKSGVIVIAATNRLDMLDEAILRPGRFDRQIPVNLPDIDERVDILKIHSRNKNISSKVSLEDIARRTPGFSGAQLENVLNEAALLAVRHDSNTITLGDIDEAIDRVVGGPAKHNRKTSFEEKKQISFHEAGHALVGLNVKGADIVEKITIIPRGKAAGYTLQTPSIQELQIQKKSDLLGLVASTLGGRASEEIIYGKDSISTGASNDLYKATRIVRAMVTQLGMTDVGLMQYVPSEGEVNPYKSDYSEKTAQEIDHKINEILYERYDFAKKVITENKRELELIVESLLILETIDRKQIEYIHKEKDLPLEVKAKIEYLVKTNQLDEAYLFEEERIQFIPGYKSNKDNNLNKEALTTIEDKHQTNEEEKNQNSKDENNDSQNQDNSNNK